MEFELNEQQRMVRDMARDFAAGEIEPNAAAWDRDKTFPKEVLAKAAKLGFMGMTIPEAYGGIGLDMLSYVLVLEEIARSCASTCVIISVQNSLFANGIVKFGSEEQRQRFLPRTAAGEILGAYLLTEPGAGSDAGSLRCKAEKAEGGWRLTGSKAFITNGGHADHGITYAVTKPEAGTKGISAFVLDLNAKGVERGPEEKKLGLHASSTVMVTLDGAFVPEADLLGIENRGFNIAMEILNTGRIGIAAQALGIAGAALDEALRYASQRQQFDSPIDRFQSVQWHLVKMATELDAARLLAYRAAVNYDAGRNIVKEAAMAKLFASRTAAEAAERAVQIHGGYGYTKDYKVERLFRDAKITELYEGTSEIQRIVIARQIMVG